MWVFALRNWVGQINPARFPTLVFSVVAILSSMACGCGGSVSDLPPLGKVSGVVTLDGKPLANARVQFQPPDSRASEGMTDENGAYTLRFDPKNYGAKVGPHVVSVTTRTDGYAKPPQNGQEGEWVKGQPESVPAKYLKPGALTAEVKAGSNTINFDLKN
ncbi:carboxypeptidase-like regulatory domain-containing protein [Planctopirus hydrillae]|nr:carboxypeptidase-like regulatory domain-containing protein [Planctopirus hydrillae]